MLSAIELAAMRAARGFQTWVLLFTAHTCAGIHVSCASARSEKRDKTFARSHRNFIFKNKKIIVDAVILFWQIVSRSLWFM